jgi:hypothetical protein
MQKLRKKGKLNEGSIDRAIMAIILIFILFKLYAILVPEAQTAGDELQTSGVPLGSLFGGNGIMFVIIMVALVILVVRSFLKGRRK